MKAFKRQLLQQLAADIVAIKTSTKWFVNFSTNRNSSIYKNVIDIEIKLKLQQSFTLSTGFIQYSNTVITVFLNRFGKHLVPFH